MLYFLSLEKENVLYNFVGSTDMLKQIHGLVEKCFVLFLNNFIDM